MKRTLYLILCAVALFIASEWLARIYIPGSRFNEGVDRTSEHPYIRKDWVRGYAADYTVGLPGEEKPVRFEINAFGFRARSMTTAAKPSGVHRIFFLGESTTESLTLDEGSAFPGVVERLLNNTQIPPRYQCVNAAMSGNLAADSLATLIYKVMYYQPDTVIVMHAINDMRYGTVPTYDPIARTDFNRSYYFSGFSEDGGAQGLLRAWCKKSSLLTLLNRNLRSRLARQTVHSKWEAMVQRRKQTPVSTIKESKSLHDFLKNLMEMVYIARGHEIRIILMTEPCIYQENMPEEISNRLWMGYLPKPGINLGNDFLNREMRRFNDAVLELRSQGVEVIDLDKEIPKTLEYFYDDVHLTAKGAAKAGEAITDYFLSGSAQPVSKAS